MTDTEQLVRRYTELDDQRRTIVDEQADIKAQLRDTLQQGTHHVAGLTIVVSPPPRRFNAVTAASLLPTETLAACTYDEYDPKKLKRYLSPVMLDMAMDERPGDLVVRIS